MNDPARQNDRELFEAVSRGNAPALAELAGRHARGLYDFALRGTLDEEQAASVLETAFRRVREPGADVPSQIDFRTWLYSLCLVEIIQLSNEVRTARISTDDERFYRVGPNVDAEIAHWAWQAARGLRTRDYCVLDLTLRRGLTPEEVAEAASLTRSNLYASIGRARGAFEETFAAMLLFEHGRNNCRELEEMLDSAPGDSLRPALRHQIIEHSDDCDACRQTLDGLPPAAEVYIALGDVDLPDTVMRRILADASEAQPQVPQQDVAPIFGTAASAAFAAGAAELDPMPPSPSADLWGNPASREPEVEPVTTGDIFEDESNDEADDTVPALVGGAAIFDEPAPEAGSTAPDEVDEPAPAVESTAPEADDVGAAGVEAEAEITEEEAEEEGELLEPEPVPVPSLLASRQLPSAAAIEDEELEDEEAQPAVRGRSGGIGGFLAGQPLMWTYALLGVFAVMAIFLGVAVANSLETGGGDAGSLPLDAQNGAAGNRQIDCGDSPIEMDAGTSTLISFDQSALDGYEIKTLSFAPDSEAAKFENLEATLENPYSIRFAAKQQTSAVERTEQYQLKIQWTRGEETASSTCELLVHVKPQP